MALETLTWGRLIFYSLKEFIIYKNNTIHVLIEANTKGCSNTKEQLMTLSIIMFITRATEANFL